MRRLLRASKGYRDGVPFDIWTVQIHGLNFEVTTGILFLRMQAEAKIQHGVDLRPTEAWRSNEYQERLYNDRKDPVVRSAKGPAARPGFSRHQEGLAVDIRTGLSFRQYRRLGMERAREKSKVYNWLCEHAEKYGFYQTIDSEPWHWERRMTLGA